MPERVKKVPPNINIIDYGVAKLGFEDNFKPNSADPDR